MKTLNAIDVVLYLCKHFKCGDDAKSIVPAFFRFY